MMVGHEQQERSFTEAFASGRMAHAWLLAGPRGIGKAAFARRAGAYLIAQDASLTSPAPFTLDVPADNAAAAQVRGGSHPEFLWLKREVPRDKRPKDGGPGKPGDRARNITIEQVRSMLARLRLQPASSRWRCVVIDSMDEMERSASNALLKMLEEPPDHTVLLLICHNPSRLLPTIRSRCRLLRFLPLDDDQMRAVIGQLDHVPADADLDILLRLAAGVPGRIARHASGDIASVHNQLSAIASRGDADNRHRLALSQSVGSSKANDRLGLVLTLARLVAADTARQSGGAMMLRSIDAEAQIADIERHAVAQTEDPATVAFAVGNILHTIGAG